MTQPAFAPIVEQARVRPSYPLSTPRRWQADRVAELTEAGQPHRRHMGVPGPDQGYALALAERFKDRIKTARGESVGDALSGACAIACARAASFGRAPVAKDIEHALVLLGLVGDAPDDLVKWRTQVLAGAEHDYRRRRAIVDLVRDSTYRLSVDEIVKSQLAGTWKELFVAPSSAA